MTNVEKMILLNQVVILRSIAEIITMVGSSDKRKLDMVIGTINKAEDNTTKALEKSK